MSDHSASTPRVFILRHGETAWARSGQSTSRTEIELNEAGRAQVSTSAARFVGPGLLIDPSHLGKVFISPRIRAKQTWDLLRLNLTGFDPDKINVTEEVSEWDYGNYEGLTNKEIKEQRIAAGLDGEQEWSLWSCGCDGGESVQDITSRVTGFIEQIKAFHRENSGNVLVVAHGAFLRCLTKLWLGRKVEEEDISFELEPGAVGVLGYKKGDVSRGSLHIGLQL